MKEPVSDNSIIARYVKEILPEVIDEMREPAPDDDAMARFMKNRYPQILDSLDFANYQLQIRTEELKEAFIDSFREAARTIVRKVEEIKQNFGNKKE